MDLISSLPLILAVLRVGSVGWAAAVTCQCQCWWLGPSLLWSHHYYLSPGGQRVQWPLPTPWHLQYIHHRHSWHQPHSLYSHQQRALLLFHDNPRSFCSGLIPWADNVNQNLMCLDFLQTKCWHADTPSLVKSLCIPDTYTGNRRCLSIKCGVWFGWYFKAAELNYGWYQRKWV